MPSAVIPPASGQHQQHTSTESSFSKLKYWFNKGVEMHGDNKASHQAKRKQQKDMDSARHTFPSSNLSAQNQEIQSLERYQYHSRNHDKAFSTSPPTTPMLRTLKEPFLRARSLPQWQILSVLANSMSRDRQSSDQINQSKRLQRVGARSSHPLHINEVRKPWQVYRETRFEDFMGKDSSSIMPPLPANVAGLAAPKTSADYRLSRPFTAAEPVEQFVDENIRPGTASTAALSVSDSRTQTWLRKPVVPNQDQRREYNPCQTCKRQVHPSTAFSYNGTYLCEDCAATRRWGDKKKESLKAKKTKVPRKPLPKTSIPSFKEKHTPASTLSTSSTLRGSLSPRIPPRQPSNEQGFLQSPKPSSPAPSNAPSSTFTPSPLSPYFATPDPVGKYPRYRTPPPPPIITTDSTSEQRLTPPPDSPLRKPKPASSIYPSTPWRLSRPPSIPSIPAVPEKYLHQEVEKTHERDTIYRAEIEEDIIDSYAVDSPVSPLSDRGNDVVEDNGTYVNANWRTRKNIF